MATTRLSKKGKVTIPKSLRKALQWKSGMKLVVVGTAEGVLFIPKHPFTRTTLDDVAGCLSYSGRAKSLEDMDAAVAGGARNEWPC